MAVGFSKLGFFCESIAFTIFLAYLLPLLKAFSEIHIQVELVLFVCLLRIFATVTRF